MVGCRHTTIGTDHIAIGIALITTIGIITTIVVAIITTTITITIGITTTIAHIVLRTIDLRTIVHLMPAQEV
jgi:hypothetical protein